MKHTYKIAGINFEVSSFYEDVHRLCCEYASEEIPELYIRTSAAGIEYEREKSMKTAVEKGLPGTCFSDGYYETLAVYREMADKLTEYGTVLYHGSVVAVDREGFLFTAKSGTGKSTHTRLWCELFGNRAVMINDDKPLIKLMEDEAFVYGTPWGGKHGLSTNMHVPLKAICILERAAENSIIEITKAEAYDMLVQQVHKPADKGKLITTLKLVDRLAECVGLYKLRCNMEIEAAQVAYERMGRK